jgi:hypothetical protein
MHNLDGNGTREASLPATAKTAATKNTVHQANMAVNRLSKQTRNKHHETVLTIKSQLTKWLISMPINTLKAKVRRKQYKSPDETDINYSNERILATN